MSAVAQPDQIFWLATTRVSCIFIGMASAVAWILVLLPKHQHWAETRHQLTVHFKATLQQAAKSLEPDPAHPARFTWRHMVDRLSALEHTLDATTAESADSRLHAPQARSLVATLFNLLAKAQAVEIHLSRSAVPELSADLQRQLNQFKQLLTALAAVIEEGAQATVVTAFAEKIQKLSNNQAIYRSQIFGQETLAAISDRFVLERLDEMLDEVDLATRDWLGLHGAWTSRRATHLAAHRDYPTAAIYGLRMFLTINLAGGLWWLTQWPSGAQFILFIAVVCSLLSLVDHPPQMGFAFLKSAAFCALMAYVEAFWWFQKGEGFLVLAVALGLFLLPAAYAYRHPRLLGSAVVSMLIFYGLSMPANRMDYDITAFLNNGLALFSAAAGGFFAFHALPSLTAAARRFWLLRAVRNDLAAGVTPDEQSWTSRMFDRLRLLHRTTGENPAANELRDAENEMLTSLQLGMRQRRLGRLLAAGVLPTDDAEVVASICRVFRDIARHPGSVAMLLRSAATYFEEILHRSPRKSEAAVIALGEIWEMTFLLENPLRLYRD
jgi:uncharacterized membrane protein YccC